MSGGYDLIVLGGGSPRRAENVHIVPVFGAGALNVYALSVSNSAATS
ncbi:MAG: hypothetical protein WA813_13445 [Beijerinckiaceae bacterium]|jgi:hypothetical protein